MEERDLEKLTVAEVSRQIRSRKVSPVDLTNLLLGRIERLNPALNAYLTLTKDQAFADARTAEKEIRRGYYRGPLHGVPFSIKDNIAMIRSENYRRIDEGTVFRVGNAYEKAAKWCERNPQLP